MFGIISSGCQTKHLIFGSVLMTVNMHDKDVSVLHALRHSMMTLLGSRRIPN
jgi:hypothetical protein